jgi:AcrR family transcriptional regulator
MEAPRGPSIFLTPRVNSYRIVRTIMPRRRYRNSHLSRERILETATELFAQKGYAGAGVDQLAARSGIAKTAIYYHFGNKAGLLAAALERAANAWIEGIDQASRQAGDWSSRLDSALAGMRALLEEKPWIFKLVQILAFEVAEEKPEIRETLQSIVRRAREAIVAGLRDALGVEVPDAEGVAKVILIWLDGISLGLQIDPEATSLDEEFVELRRITTFAVATRLNPDLARWFDQPPGKLSPAEPGRRPPGGLARGEEE